MEIKIQIDPYYEHLGVELALNVEKIKYILYPNETETAMYKLGIQSVEISSNGKKIYPE